MTNDLLMTKGPDAAEFNNRSDFGNLFTKMKYKLIHIHFLLQD
jgi:hypothetical protein